MILVFTCVFENAKPTPSDILPPIRLYFLTVTLTMRLWGHLHSKHQIRYQKGEIKIYTTQFNGKIDQLLRVLATIAEDVYSDDSILLTAHNHL